MAEIDAKIDFKPGEVFETHGSHALKAVEMVSTDPKVLDRFLYNEAMDTRLCSGCDGTLKEVQACIANTLIIGGETTEESDKGPRKGPKKGPAALSYQCGKKAMKVIERIAEDVD